MAKIDKQINYDFTYRPETFDEYKNRRIDEVWKRYTGHARGEAISPNQELGRIPGTFIAMSLISSKQWNKRTNRAYDSAKQIIRDEKSYEVPVSASLGIVGSDSPVQTNVSYETPMGAVDYSGQKRKKGSGISYNLGLF